MVNMKPTTIEIGQGIKCSNLPLMAQEQLKKDLTFDNPSYKNAVQMGKYSSAPPHIYLFEAEKNTYWFPRGYVFFLIRFLKYKNIPYKIVDHTICFKPNEQFRFKGTLRDYQIEAESKILRYPIGVLEAGTGSGKTTIALSVMAKRQQPTLIIVHTRELLLQWKDRISQFLGEGCGLIGDGKFDIKPITVGTIQTINKRVQDLRKLFGFLVIDECHRHVSTSSLYTIQQFSARYYLGLTATPFRSDGLGKMIFSCMGPKIHCVNKKNLLDTNAILRPKVMKVETNFHYLFTGDYARMISELINDSSRNQLICAKIASDLQAHNEQILIVSDRTTHVKIIHKSLEYYYNIPSVCLIGSSKKTERDQTIAQLKSGKAKVLIATTSLIGEGFDMPNLTALFLTTPIKFSGRVIQSCGRVLRPAKGKTPRIYDFRDSNVGVLRASGFNRDRVYKNEWQ